MDQLPLWLSALPKEMQGALMTIAGGALTALFGGIGWLAKTWNDRSKERIQREMAMRKEVFMPVSEAVVEAMGFAGGLANDMRPDAEIQVEFLRLACKFAPLQVVGSDATIQASGEFSAKFTTLFLAVLDLRQKIRSAHLESEYAQSLEDKAKWAKAAATYSNQPLKDLLQQHLKQVQLAQGELILAMRKEFGLKTNKGRYRETLDSVEKQVMGAYEETRKSIFSEHKTDQPS